MPYSPNFAGLLCLQTGIPTGFEGSPGTAKTASFKSLAKRLNRVFVPWILRQMMPEEVRGFPKEGSYTTSDGVSRQCCLAIPTQEILQATYEQSLVLLDELNQAGHDVLGAAQEWINNPPPGCLIAAAWNPVEQSTAGSCLPPAVVNRMAIFKWEIPHDAIDAGWANGFRNYPEPEVPVLPDDYLDVHGEMWGRMLVQFKHIHPELMDERGFPKDRTKTGDPWPSPRSWEHVGKLMAACDAAGADKHSRKLMVKACVGEAAGITFGAWVDEQNLPDPEAILSNPATLKLPPRFDLARSICGSVVGRIRADRDGDRWEQSQDVIEVAYGQSAECATMMYTTLTRLRPSGHKPRHRNGAILEIQKLVAGLS